MGSQIQYAIDHGPFQVYFTSSGMTYRFDKKLPRQKWDKSKPISSQEEWEGILARRKAVRMESTLVHVGFANANTQVELIAEDPLDEYFSYGMGSNNINYNFIKGFKKLTYRNLYPGIDLEFTFHPDKGFKYQFVVMPGADPRMIGFSYSGDVAPILSPEGHILLKTQFGDLVDHAPVSFLGNSRAEVKTSFKLDGNTVRFDLASYDATKELTIDPWVVFPPSPNSNKVWEVETDNSGNVYAYMGDSPFYLRKYNSSGVLQWSYSSSWDSSGFWVGGMVTHPNGDSYITTGSNGEIRKISPAGSQVWYNNPNGLTSYEYWSLAFNCDLTQLVVGGSRATFSIPFPVIRGTMMNINLSNGSIASTTVVGFGNITGIPPRIQEASSICSAPNGNYYFLTLDTIGSINNALNTIGFKIPTLYNFDYYIPGYGFGTKQPISATRANANALYTHDGQTLHKRDLLTGAILATASIPGGIVNTLPIFNTKTQGNGGLDLDNCGNVYVGSGSGVYKFDPSLNLLASTPTSGPVYDVDVTTSGIVAASGSNFVATISLASCSPQSYICGIPVNVQTSSTAASCFGTCDGTLSVTGSGGVPPLSYLWSNGSTAQNVSGVCPGNYTVTVTDAVGTSVVSNVTVSSASQLNGSLSNVTNVSCAGGSNGGAVVAVSGGTGPYTYLWNSVPAQTSSTLSNVPAGSYQLYITDSQGCVDTLNVSIGQPAPLSIQTSTVSSTCSQSNGSVSAIVNGGTAPFAFLWNTTPNQSGSTANGLLPGTYSVTVTDANGCTSQSQATVSGTTSISTTITSVSNILCNGASNGGATVVASGGSGGVNYVWNTNPVQTGASLVNVPAGVYQVVATDSVGCQDSLTVNITEPAPLSAQISSTSTSCSLSNGTATVLVSGGVSPYSYLWNTSPVQLSSTANNLDPGSYSVVVTDGNGCNLLANISVGSIPSPVVMIDSTTAVTCNGAQDGSAVVSATGGVSPYQFTWNTNPPQLGAVLSNIGGGSYQVILTDASGCNDTLDVLISEPLILTVSTSAVAASCSQPNGTASATVSGGVAPYSYFWNTSPPQTNATAVGLVSGVYGVSVTDNNGCTSQAQIVVPGTIGLSITATSQSGCASSGSSATVAVSNGTAPFTYVWSPSVGNTATVTGLPSGTYQCLVTDVSGCSQTVSLNVSTYPDPVAFAGTDTIITAGQQITLSATGGVSFAWTPNVGLVCDTCQSTIANPTATTTYCVLVTDINGCTNSDCKTVTVNDADFEPCGEVFVPTAFSPDGTNSLENERFCVYGRCITSLEISIYDRWGKKVFESNSKDACWDGTLKGERLNTGVYMYVANIALANGERMVKKGDVSLVR